MAKNNPGPLSDPEEFRAEEIEEALTNRALAFRRRRREFFNDGGEVPESDPTNPVAESPFTTRVTGTQKQAVEKVHEARSERAQRADESFNAPTTTDAQKWARNKDQLDYPGVDTVPQSRLRERANQVTRRASERGFVSSVSREAELEGGLRGYASYSGDTTDVSVDRSVATGEDSDPRFDEGPVLAHEVGHAVDNATDFQLSDELAGDNASEQIREEAKRVSQTMRGVFEDAPEEQREYRESSRELFADVFASLQTQPQATKREAPNLTQKIDDVEFEDGLDEFF
jgi:hypothetical protein